MAPSRSNQFSAPHFEPFNHDPNVELKPDKVDGPASFFNPTRARFDYTHNDKSRDDRLARLTGRIGYKWRSRDNRKGRHTIVVDPNMDPAEAKLLAPELSSSFRHIRKILWRMVTYFPVWDVSYLIAQFFTWGSVIFTINGLFYWLPLVAPGTAFNNEGKVGGGVTAFVGTVFFQIGVILLIVEAVNPGRSGCFGFALEEVFSHDDQNGEDSEAPAMAKLQLRPTEQHCVHHNPNRKGIFSFRQHNSDNAPPTSNKVIPISPPHSTQQWIWWPSWADFKTHYIHEIGFLAALVYFIAGTIFWIIGFTSLPNVEQSLSTGELYGVFWTPDIVGSVGFVIGSYLIMLETQPNWYTPAIGVLGWHIGLWNLIGSIGFLLSASFGVAWQALDAPNVTWRLYQSDLSTTWGSIAFLIASVILWYESLDKHVVEKMK